ncbi:MAG: hypothetical protein WKF61_06480 [Luteimonas sp.]
MAFAIALAAASFSSLAANAYKVSANVSHHGERFASPSVVVEMGVRAEIEVSGPDGYRLMLTVDDAGEGKLRISANLDTAHGAMSPVVIVRAGQSATVSVGDMEIGLIAIPHDG